MRQLNILTWHIHGNYLYYLAQCPHLFYLPVKPGRPEGYGGRCGTLPWPDNVVEVPADQVPNLKLDCVLFQSQRNYERDQHEILSPEQLELPQLYLEHDPPRENPTDTRHPAADSRVLLVHVTNFNALMWDNGRTEVRVIEHGVLVPDDVSYSGELPRGIVVVNNIVRRGRRLGLDAFLELRSEVALDLIGMGAEQAGGLGEVVYKQLPSFIARYRFFFNPIRYTSLGLAVCEALMLGVPVVAFATTEMATVIRNGYNGFADTSAAALKGYMEELICRPGLAEELSRGARKSARERFAIERFIADWESAWEYAVGRKYDGRGAAFVDRHRLPAEA